MKTTHVVLTVFVLFLFVGFAAAMPHTTIGQAQDVVIERGEPDSQTPPSNYVPIPVKGSEAPEMVTGVAVFMDVLPWGSPAIVNTLTTLGIPYTPYNSSAMSTAILSNYKLVIIAGDQDQNFYTNLVANMSRFEDYVRNSCGVLQVHTAALGWNGGNPYPSGLNVILPGGVTLNGPIYNAINHKNPSLPGYPPTLGVPNPFNGTFASHGAYSSLVGGTSIAAFDAPPASGRPTLIEYPLGQGIVLAGMQPFSYGVQFGQHTGTIMEDLINYAYNTVEPACAEEYSYSVKFVCGTPLNNALENTPVVPGTYATEINIHNYSDDTTFVEKKVLPVVTDYVAIGREPNFVSIQATDAISLPHDTATMDDCYRFAELLYGAAGLPLPPTLSAMPLTIGFLELTSPIPLRVDAVYTTYDQRRTVSIDVQHVEANPTIP